MKKLYFLSGTLLATGVALSQNVSIGHTVPVVKLDIRGVEAGPSIPGFASTGILRVGVSIQEGIDMGRLTTPTVVSDSSEAVSSRHIDRPHKRPDTFLKSHGIVAILLTLASPSYLLGSFCAFVHSYRHTRISEPEELCIRFLHVLSSYTRKVSAHIDADL